MILEHELAEDGLGVDLPRRRSRQIRRMDDPSNMDDLADLGRRAAEEQIKPEHLPAGFDLANAK